MKGMELALKGLEGIQTDLPEETKEMTDKATKEAKKKMADLKKQIFNLTKQQSKF